MYLFQYFNDCCDSFLVHNVEIFLLEDVSSNIFYMRMRAKTIANPRKAFVFIGLFIAENYRKTTAELSQTPAKTGAYQLKIEPNGGVSGSIDHDRTLLLGSHLRSDRAAVQGQLAHSPGVCLGRRQRGRLYPW